MKIKATLTGTLKVECCKCGADMGTKPCTQEQDGLVSHGYCPACLVLVRDEIANMGKR